MKHLFTILAVSAVAMASAQVPTVSTGIQQLAPSSAVKAPEFAPSSSNDLRFCGDFSRWDGLAKSYELVQYIYISPEVATSLAGNKITSICYAPALAGGQDMSATRKGVAFVTEDIKGEFTTSVNITVRDSYGLVYNGGSPIQESSFSRNKQYEIKENTGFYFGYKMTVEDNDFPFAVDDLNPVANAGWVDVYEDGEFLTTYNIGDLTGNNLLLYARMSGDKLAPAAFLLGDVSFGNLTEPIFTVENPMSPQIYVNNIGYVPLQTVSYSYTYDDKEVVGPLSVDINIPAGKTGNISLPIENVPTGRSAVKVIVHSINDVDANNTSGVAEFFSIPADKASKRKFLVEKATGTWCGYCPIGIYAFEYLDGKYPDDFIGISMHNADEFAVSSYQQFLLDHFSELPACIINRDPAYQALPYYVTLDELYNNWKEQVSPAELKLEVSGDDSKIDITATTTFGVDDPDREYRLVLVVTEDGLEGIQTNYYAIASYCNPEMDYAGWENMPYYVEMEYDYTAVAVSSNPYGDAKSAIRGPEAGKDYVFNTSFRSNVLSHFDNGDPKFDAAKVIAILVDRETGVCVAAAKSDITYDTVGVSVEAADEVKASYYTLQGVKVANPVKGNIYIKVQGSESSKIVF